MCMLKSAVFERKQNVIIFYQSRACQMWLQMGLEPVLVPTGDLPWNQGRGNA